MVNIPKRHTTSAVLEDQNQQNAQQNAQSNGTDNSTSQIQVQTLQQKFIGQITALLQKLANKKKEYNDFESTIRQQILLIKKQAGDKGILLDTANEQVTSDFSMVLYESLTQDSNIGILCDAIKNTFDALVGKLSYYFDEKGCLTWAKDLNSWLNDARMNWYKNEDHWNDVAEELNRYMKKSKSRFLDGDCQRFISTFKNELMNGKSKSVFGWIFGNNRVVESSVNESFVNKEISREIEEHGGLSYQSIKAKYDARARAMYDIRTADYCGYLSEETVTELDEADLLTTVEPRLLYTNDGGAIVIKQNESSYAGIGVQNEWQKKVSARNKAYNKEHDITDYAAKNEIYVQPNERNTIRRRNREV